MKRSIKEIYQWWSATGTGQFQMVLKFSNDNAVVISGIDLEENSKFVRRSKRRLGEEFELAGYIVDGEIVEEYQPGCGEFWRTYCKGKCNYFLYVGRDFDFVENVKRRSYKKDDKATQITINSLTKPDVERVIDVLGLCNQTQYWCKLDSPMFKDSAVISERHDTCSRNYYVGQYMGVILALRTVLQYAGSVDKVRVFADKSIKYSAGVYNLPLGKWKPFNKECQTYRDMMIELKDKMAQAGISIVFMQG